MAIDFGADEKLALLAQGLDQLDIGFTVFDRDLVMIAANKRFGAMLNFPEHLCRAGTTMEQALRHNATVGEYGPGDIDALVRPRLELARQFLPHRFERTRPDGSIIEVCGNPLPGGGMATTYTDVTQARLREQALVALSAELEQRVDARTQELKQREKELAHKAALLEQVISNVNQGISFINSDLVIELCNQKFSELLDLPSELCQPGVSFETLAHFNAQRGEYGPGDPDELARMRIDAARKFIAHRFERTRPSDGVTLEVMGQPTPDGGMVSTYLDVTEHKAIENALREEREQLRHILQGTHAGTMEYDLVTGRVKVNARWAEILGYTLDELGPITSQTLMGLCHPSELEAIMQAMFGHFKGHTDYYKHEHRVRHRNGHWVWVAAHGQVSARSADGRALKMAGVHLDITERKVAEDRIRELNETLEERVAERSQQLSLAMQSLHRSQEELARSAAKATLSTLVASVTHELNTPLGNSLMTASTCSAVARTFEAQFASGQLKRSDMTQFLQQISEGTALVERNLHRAVDLVKNFKQVASDQASEQRREFEVAAVINEVLDTLSPTLKRFAHHVEVRVEPDIWINSYPGALGQVVINLVNNAYLHAFDNHAEGTVRIAAKRQDGLVHLTVNDNGAGMDSTLLAQLFQPFFSTKIGRGGTGLGMTIVENLVKKVLGGSLQVHSVVGQGSTFTIQIPLNAPDFSE